jgi:hypothetical protein
MKTFKQHITEGVDGVGVETGNSVEDSNIGAHNIHEKEVLQKVNAFVGSIGDQEYIAPQAAVEALKNKLATIGLSFDANLEGEKGSTTVEVTQHGGRFGKDTDGSDINDDGISHRKEGGLKIEFKHETLQNGATKVYAKLI